ncbi:MAG: hypothetical protein SOU51_06995 [Collinsella sp.]|nr:hypothetical protein [Collinsella sp.]
MIRRQLINLGSANTDFRMGFGAFDELPRMVPRLVTVPNRALLATDGSVPPESALIVSRALVDAGFHVVEAPIGRDDAPVASVERSLDIYRTLEGEGFTSDDLLVALGGIDLCSLISFVARTWCGGMAHMLAPSELDAMVTIATATRGLSVGASTEMVSTDPRANLVVCDLDLVASSSLSTRLHGYVHMLASALFDSKRQWDRFGDMIPDLVAGDEIALLDCLGKAQASRSAVLNSSNPSARNALQFGLTTARALGELLGEGVESAHLLAEGMRFEARLAHDACGFEIDDVFDLDDRLADLGIDELPFEIEPARFIDALRESRFKRYNRFMLSLPRHPGTIRLTVVDQDVFERHAEAYLASRAELVSTL